MKSRFFQAARYVSYMLLLSVAGVSNADNDSLLNGGDVTAQGSNPEWNLEIMKKGRKVNFTAADPGTHNFKYPSQGPTLRSKQNTTVYHVPNTAHPMTVQVKHVACNDTVTGKSHGARVIVWLDTEGYVGCGDIN